jgi:GTPase Era involved in 16S rRNA processing
MFNVKNIAVCATMSAGKSTFVNALLGRDVLPARNEPTTAKITSVYDKDGAEKMIGYVTKNGEIAEQSEDVTLEVIDKWNSSNMERIYLQGDLDGIKNNGFVVAVHDTPGTNNSGDKSHHDVTMDFLQKNRMDALIFVANATQLCTTDERILLVELLNKVVEPSKLPVIFILNQADRLDEEKESVQDIQKRYCEYLEEIGFVEPKIFPISAKAARLLKMAKNGRTENLTAREKSDLKSAIAEFTDLHDFSCGVSQNCDSEIETALLRSGLQNVEKYIESLF